ncbi:hypothetical protein NGK10_16855 [Enterobacter quasiroggenkampii]|uniref:hypothetical protein n=1 Tax=Enterobacter quasiroggenkampii TaxID=2497436 RepID=UPI002DB65B0E|nr:hypothetical protein [Enterobacter quasiroggenkampii]MEB7934001.1 hypothetical protein [Enterobacter quasiroggenkampii]
MSWNKHEAVSYTRSHAHHKSTGYCVRAVAAAIRAGGLKIIEQPLSLPDISEDTAKNHPLQALLI